MRDRRVLRIQSIYDMHLDHKQVNEPIQRHQLTCSRGVV